MSITYTIPVVTVSEANRRDHWAKKARRVKAQRHIAFVQTLSEAGSLRRPAGDVRLYITLCRVAPRIMDTDNLAGAMKAVRDGIAEALGIDDGDERITWDYEQRKPMKGEQQAVEVIIAAKKGGAK